MTSRVITNILSRTETLELVALLIKQETQFQAAPDIKNPGKWSVSYIVPHDYKAE